MDIMASTTRITIMYVVIEDTVLNVLAELTVPIGPKKASMLKLLISIELSAIPRINSRMKMEYPFRRSLRPPIAPAFDLLVLLTGKSEDKS